MTQFAEQYMKHILKTAAGLAVLAGLSIGIVPVEAHHSTSMFDRSKVMTIKGVVTEFRWVNPHASISVEGKINDGDAPQVWIFEMTSPGNLVRIGGWRRDAVQPGDQVEVTFNPLREADHRGGALRTLKIDGTGEVLTSNLIGPEQQDVQ
jgi:Family of unknown function (DUF6152)